MNYEEKFPWDEFYERYTKNHEEFSFNYKGDWINLVTDWDGFLYTIGNDELGYTPSKIYSSPEELLNNEKFDGKSLKDIWNDLG